jgi:hypothetical protein
VLGIQAFVRFLSGRLPRGRATLGIGDLFGRESRACNIAQFEESFPIVEERSLTSGQHEPDIRRDVVPRHARTREVQLAQLILRAKIITIGGPLIPSRGFRNIGCDTATLLKKISDRSLSRSAAVFRRQSIHASACASSGIQRVRIRARQLF